MPLLLISYMLQFFDKAALGYTAILGIQADTGLSGRDYSWVSSTFYFGYLIASCPASFAFVKFPLGKFLATCVLAWAVILAFHGAAMSFASLTVLRFLLGICESTISPGFSLVTGLWYKPSEHASRHGLWFAGNTASAIFGGLLSYAISHIQSPIASWRWLFIIFGIITFVWGIVLFIFLPDSPLNARFLSADQRTYAYRRPQQDTHSFKTKEWKMAQFIEALVDPKTWLIFVFAVCSQIPNGGLTSFGSIVVEGFGFDTFTTILLSIPSSAFGLFFVLSSTYIAHRFKYSRCILIAVLQIIALTGCTMVYKLPITSKWARLGAIWLFSAYASCLPIIFAIVASNVAGYTKKTTVLAILFIGYCAGNIVGPQLFFADEAPEYHSAFEGILVCMVLSVVSIMVMRQYMVWENKRRDREQGVEIDPESKKVNTEEHLVQTGLDETDWVNKRFRYYL
jgi:ACS family allantoate permease-like MFS transporter